jgi:hypothetical protein
MTREQILKNKNNLQGADLRGVNLRGADLRGANLRGANLGLADLCAATLSGADLSGADFCGANLYAADLCHTDLRDADLCGANLYAADLCGAKNIPSLVAAQLSICPEGVLKVYKKCQEGIVILEVPAHAQRSNSTGRKCRASEALVIETPNHQPAHSLYCNEFVYEEGEVIKPDLPFDADRWVECGSGIHFYLTREEAEAWG